MVLNFNPTEHSSSCLRGEAEARIIWTLGLRGIIIVFILYSIYTFVFITDLNIDCQSQIVIDYGQDLELQYI